MIIGGVTAEYNVFHNGHLYQLKKIKEECDAAVVIMSGSFVQRGDIAITDKWQRAAAAAKCGADLVIELPVVFALNTAQKFAYGAVSLLDMCGADRIYFGSECGDIDALKKAAKTLENEPAEVSGKIKALVSEGMSFPAAREKAFEKLMPDGLLKEPNNILATEYIRAALRIKSGMEPVTIKREGVGHNDSQTSGNIASASKIREMIFNNENYLPFVPVQYTNIPYDKKRLEGAVIYRLRSMSAMELSEINEVEEGLENRIIGAAKNYGTLEDIFNAAKTKRYTASKINRIMFSSLLGLTKDMSDKKPSYIRVLALNGKGAKILKRIKNSSFDIITKTADYRSNDPMFKKDILSTDIAALCAHDINMRRGGLDYLISPVFCN